MTTTNPTTNRPEEVTKMNTTYTVRQDADGFFYSYARSETSPRRGPAMQDEQTTPGCGFDTMRQAVYHLMDLIESGTVPGGSITIHG